MTLHYNNKFWVFHLYDDNPVWYHLPYTESIEEIKQFNAIVHTPSQVSDNCQHICQLGGEYDVYELLEFDTEQDYMFFLLKWG